MQSGCDMRASCQAARYSKCSSGTTSCWHTACAGRFVDDLWRSWSRTEAGTWTCLAGTTLDHPNGRIQVTPGASFTPGTIYMGVDVAAWLDERMREHEGRRKRR